MRSEGSRQKRCRTFASCRRACNGRRQRLISAARRGLARPVVCRVARGGEQSWSTLRRAAKGPQSAQACGPRDRADPRPAAQRLSIESGSEAEGLTALGYECGASSMSAAARGAASSQAVLPIIRLFIQLRLYPSRPMQIGGGCALRGIQPLRARGRAAFVERSSVDATIVADNIAGSGATGSFGFVEHDVSLSSPSRCKYPRRP